MMQKPGLPAKMDFSAIPNYYLNMVMPHVQDLLELKLSLHLFKILTRKKGNTRYTTFNELASDPVIIESIRQKDEPPLESLRKTLSRIISRGLLIPVQIDQAGSADTAYLLNTPANSGLLESINRGEVKLAGMNAPVPDLPGCEPQPDIFGCYEQNIGMLTPLVADELKEAEKNYPSQWIVEAIREAALNNKRNWRYISRILERWLTEGKNDGTYRQDYSPDDPAKYTTGKYQQFVQH